MAAISKSIKPEKKLTPSERARAYDVYRTSEEENVWYILTTSAHHPLGLSSRNVYGWHAQRFSTIPFSQRGGVFISESEINERKYIPVKDSRAQLAALLFWAGDKLTDIRRTIDSR